MATVVPSPHAAAQQQHHSTPPRAERRIFTPSPPKVPPPKPPPTLPGVATGHVLAATFASSSSSPASPPKSVQQLVVIKSNSSPQSSSSRVFKRADVHPLPQGSEVVLRGSVLGPMENQQPALSPAPPLCVEQPKQRGTFVLADFELGVTLGTGSFGRVCFARLAKPRNEHEKQLRVAVKMLKKVSVIRQNQVEHTKHERAILEVIGLASWNAGEAPWAPKAGTFGHPFIVKMFGSFQDTKRLYIVLEYVRGGELFSHLRRRGHLKNHQAMFFTASVASVFAFLHAGDIAYRDLKPENLLLDHEGFVKVTDFGFAKRVEDKTYTLCGTPEYIAPEVLLNKGHGRSVDWWALGILTYEMLSGQAPFVSLDPMAIYQQVVNSPVMYPAYFEPEVRSLLRRLLERDVTKRFGCQIRGAADVCEHRWFSGFSFERLLARDVQPPIVPPGVGIDDTSNFEDFADVVDDGNVDTPASDPFAAENFDCVLLP